MKINYLHSFGRFDLDKYQGELEPMKKDQILIKTKYCGICRNDIKSFAGEGFIMSQLRQGHENLGVVEALGIDYKGSAKVGDFVSAFDSDPGFGEYFYTDATRSVVVPELSPKYILEPVSCAINIAIKTLTSILTGDNDLYQPKILLIGSGFMSILIKEYFTYIGVEVEVCGNSNRRIWDDLSVNLKPFRFYLDKKETFDAIIDLSGTAKYYKEIVETLSNASAVICMASTPKEPLQLDFNTSAWKDLTYVFPSPRTHGFLDVMILCSKLIESKILNTEVLWTQYYKFDSIEECRKGFKDGWDRSPNYIKGYISF